MCMSPPAFAITFAVWLQPVPTLHPVSRCAVMSIYPPLWCGSPPTASVTRTMDKIPEVVTTTAEPAAFILGLFTLV